MCDVMDDIENEEVINRVKDQVLELCSRFPVYGK
jgi:glycine hydroxymethyltransferase